jgi:tripartite-type tricarboxylate transporter receptor subunit TctC
MEVVGFYGVMAPAATPTDVVAKLSDAFQQVLANPDLRTAMTAQGADPAFLNSEQFGAYLVAQMPVWAMAVKDWGAKLD